MVAVGGDAADVLVALAAWPWNYFLANGRPNNYLIAMPKVISNTVSVKNAVLTHSVRTAYAAAAPWDTTVLCARAPLDVGGGIEVEGL